MIHKLVFSLALLLPGGLLAAAHADAAKADVAKHTAVRLVWTRFVSADSSTAAIVIGGPNGKHVRALTHPASGVVDVDAQISPNGRKLL